MKLGCAIAANNFAAIKTMKNAGYDFVETQVTALAGMTDAELDEFGSQLDKYGYKCEALNCLFPASLKVVGPEADEKKIIEYLERVFERTAPRYGYDVVVFGCGGARNLPDGFPYEKAVEQTIYLCREILTPLAKKYGFKIALEELSSNETNFMNFVSEAYDIAKKADTPEICIVADSYHIELSGEPISVLENMGDKIIHAHTANPLNRDYPSENDTYRYDLFLNALHKAGYDGRLTVEAAAAGDLECRIKQSAKLFKKLF